MTVSATDRTVFQSHNGEMIQRSPVEHPDRANFVIQVYIQYAWRDWSGFRTLAECQAQFPELLANIAAKPDREYRVVER